MVVELPVIKLVQDNQNGIFTLLGDWRLYFGLMINGLFTGIGVGFANAVHEWRKEIKEKLKKKIKERGNDK